MHTFELLLSQYVEFSIEIYQLFTIITIIYNH